MSLQRRDQKRDGNEEEIIRACLDMDCSVDQLPGGGGRPDLLIGDPTSKANILIEVKMPGKTFNPQQKTWHSEWRGRAHVARTATDARIIIQGYRDEAKRPPRFEGCTK